MKYTINKLLGSTLLFCSLTFAEQVPEPTMASCEFQANTARQVQTVRLSEGDDWSQFEQKVNKTYQQGQGRTELLNVAKQVYFTPLSLSADEVYAEMLSACIELVNN